MFFNVNNHTNMAPLTDDDRTLIRILKTEKHFNAYQMMTEFPTRNWNKDNLNRLIRQIDESGSSKRKPASGRPRSARNADNIARVADLICSQEDNPGTSKSPREIERETGISRSSIRRIVKKDLNLRSFRCQKLSDKDCLKRFDACKRLKQRMTPENINKTWFSDEKIFTVQTPTNTLNDRV